MLEKYSLSGKYKIMHSNHHRHTLNQNQNVYASSSMLKPFYKLLHSIRIECVRARKCAQVHVLDLRSVFTDILHWMGVLCCFYLKMDTHTLTKDSVVYAIIKMMENEMLKINKNGMSCFSDWIEATITIVEAVVVVAPAVVRK